jgi:O-antigen/teichoic acid export membrane protein
MKTIKHKFKKNSLVIYSTTSFINTLISLGTAFVALSWISPNEMGIWQTLILMVSYADIAKLGILSGLNRELPFLLGAKKLGEARKLVATSQFHVMVISTLGLVLAAGSLLVLKDFDESILAQAVIAIFLYWVFSVLSSFLQITFRNTEHYDLLAVGYIIHGAFSLGGLMLVINWGFSGFLIMRTGALAIFSIYLLLLRPIIAPVKTDKESFFTLVKTGLPIHGVSYIFALAMGLDRLFLLKMGGVEMVGLFAPATQITNIMMALPFSITAYMNPKSLILLGKSNEPSSIRAIALKTAALVFLTSALFAIAAWLTLPVLIDLYFPSYFGVVEATRIMLIAGVFLSLRSMTMVLASLKKWRSLYIYSILFLLFRYGFLLVFTKTEDPLIGVALGSAFSFFLSSFFILGFVLHATRPNSESQS